MNDLKSRVFYGPMIGSNTLKNDKAVSQISGDQVSELNMVVSRNLKELDCSIDCLGLMVQLSVQGEMDERSMNQVYTMIESLLPHLKDLQTKLRTKIKPSFLAVQSIEDKEDDWS